MPAGFLIESKLRPIIGECNGIPIASQSSSTITLNRNSKAKSGTNATGEDSHLNPYGVLSEDVLNHGNIWVVTVPPGASYLDIVHEFTGTGPTTSPKIRVFGEVPTRDGANVSWPADFDTDFFQPGVDHESTDWKPLGDLRNADFDPELTGLSQSTATSQRSEPKTVSVAGCSRVMVLIDTAADVVTKGQIVGWFGR